MPQPWETAGKQPWETAAGVQVKQAPPTYQYEGPTAAASLTGKTIANTKDAATLPSDIVTSRNQAISSGIKVKSDQVDLNIKTGTPPGDPSKYGDEYVASLPPGVRDLTEAMLGGKYKGNVTNSRNPTVIQAAIAAQHATHGQFDAGKYDERLALMKSMTDPNSSLGALNTALAHAGVLYDQASNVAGTSALGHNALSVGLNALSNTWNGASPAVSTYEGTVGKYGPEQAKAYGIGTGGERQGIERQYSVNLPLDTKQALLQNDAHLFSGKIASLAHGYDMLGANSALDYLSPDAKASLQKIDPDTYKKLFGAIGPGNQPQPDAPPSVGPSGGNLPPGGNSPTPGSPPDYSAMVGGPTSTVAQGRTRNIFDSDTASHVSAMIRAGVPVDQANAYVASHNYPGFDPKTYTAAVAFAKGHHGATNVEVDRTVPVTLGQRLAGSGPAAAAAGFGAGLTGGLADVAGRTIAGPAWDGNRAALAATHPNWDLAGNTLGGVAGAIGTGAAADAANLGAHTEALFGAKTAAKLGNAAPTLGDLAYGATYGASENPNAPLTGAATGALTGGIAGAVGRRAATTLGSMVAPTGGNLAALYKANPDVRATMGQALSSSNSRVARALGMGEQAAESIPALGGIQTSARTAATDQMQRGAFNSALGEIGAELPDGVVKGPQAHAFMQSAFDKAYDGARDNMRFAADPQYAQDLGNWQRNTDAMALSGDQVSHVQNVIGSALKGRVNGGTMDGANYKAAASDLSSVARKWAGNQSTAGQAAYLRDFVSIMDDAAKRASPPEAGQMLDRANSGYAKAVIVENAAKSAGGEPTEFTGKNLLRAVQGGDSSVRDRAFLRGQGLMQDYATAASKLSPSLADSGTPQRLAWMKLGGGGEAATLGALAATGHPLALAPWAVNTLANLPGARSVVGAAIAPRDATLPAILSQPLNLAGRKIDQAAPYIGRGASLAGLAYSNGR